MPTDALDGWRTYRIAELADVYDGPHATPKTVDSGPVFLGIQALKNGRIVLGATRHVSEDDFVRWTRRIEPREDDLVFSYETRLGEAALIPSGLRCCLGRRMGLLRIKPDAPVIPRMLLLAYLGPQFQAELREHTIRGSTVDRLPLVRFGDFRMVLPPVAEQRAIADVLGSVDDKIESNQRQVIALHRCAALQVQHAVGGTELQSIYEVASVTYGAPFSSKLFAEPGEGRPLIRIRDLHSQCPGIWTTEAREGARLIVPGDIVVGMDAEFRAHLWAGRSGWLNQRVCAFDPAPGVSLAYLLEVIKRPLAFYEATKGGTTVIHLGKRDIDEFRVPKPPTDVMAQLIRDADPLLTHAVGLRRENESLRAVRDALLPKLVSGQIRIPLSDDVEEGVGAAIEALA